MLSRQRGTQPHNLNSFQTLSTTGRTHLRQDSFDKGKKLKKAHSRDLGKAQPPIARLSSAKRQNQSVMSDAGPSYSAALTAKKRTNSNSARKPPESTSVRRKNTKGAAPKENSNSRANRTLNDDECTLTTEQSTLAVNDVHNFSTIVKPYHDSQEDRLMPQAANDRAVSGQFSIFDQKKLSLQNNLPPSLPSSRRPPQQSQRGGIF